MGDSEGIPEDPRNIVCTFECEASSTTWKVIEATVNDTANEPYHLSVWLQSDEVDVDPTEMLGEPCNVIVERGDVTNQYPAIVHRIEDRALTNRFVAVTVEASAALWMLSLNQKTRIFQDMTVPEILDDVLGEGLKEYDRKVDGDLSRKYLKCEYRLQYDESDFAFCSRLMEEEGIRYWFDRESTEETLFLIDDPLASFDIESTDGSDIQYSSQKGAREAVLELSRSSVMRPNVLSMRNYNWTTPAVAIEEEEEGKAEGDATDGSVLGPKREVYEHDRAPPTLSEYNDDDGYQSNDAEDLCLIRRELSARNKLVLQGESSAVGFAASGAFSLLKHELEGDYVLTTVIHSINTEEGTYTNAFACIPADTPNRPDRITPKPRVAGIETATVVGPSGQEIHTDKHGRVRVQFHWDREGDNDDHSSCFIRVVQPWAGAGWGFVFIPRIGMEVTVAFIHGDPDRPIVTGSVYNGENLTPYELPDDMTKSTLRTQSSPGGDGYNELTFEDKAGEEQVFLQAQKDLLETIKNDHTNTVGANRSVTIDKNDTIHIKGSQNITIDGTEDGDDVKGGKMSITGDYKLDTSNEIMVEAPTKITLTCGGSTIEMEPDKITVTAGGGAKITLDPDALIQSMAGAQVKLDPNVEATSVPGAKMKLDANALMQSVPGAKVELSANANILAPVNAEITAGVNADINATNASMTAAAQAKVTGAATAELTGGGQAKVTGGMVSVTGGMVSIN